MARAEHSQIEVRLEPWRSLDRVAQQNGQLRTDNIDRDLDRELGRVG